MKTASTATLKLTQLPSGGMEMVITGNWPLREDDVDPIVLDDKETKVLKDFLNDSSPAST